ncbi:MAG: hypothetical protein HS115_07255 [Spirochaetales bacterium]|nr:hypothetical protein [Spirochaetales bacterium]
MKTLNRKDLSETFSAHVVRNNVLTPAGLREEIHEIELSIDRPEMSIQPGQSIGLIVRGPHPFGNDYHFRLYTVAHHTKDRIDLLVKRCFYIDEVNGQEYPGIASHYLCDAKKGDRLDLLGPYDRPFVIPAEDTANIVMIGMGTGIAPFRAYLRALQARYGKYRGTIRLFYGTRSGLEVPYLNDAEDFLQYYDRNTFEAIQAVVSIPAGNAQSRIADSLARSLEERAREVLSLLEKKDSYLFLAGLSLLEERLENSFARICGGTENWQELKGRMRSEGRYQEILY